jgi:hypothetical protein
MYNPLTSSVTLTLVPAIEGSLEISPTVATFLPSPLDSLTWVTNIAIVPKQKGLLRVSYVIGGYQECECNLNPVGGKCSKGCSDGSGYMPMDDDVIAVYDADHVSVFERLGIAFGTLPTGWYDVPLATCGNGKATYTLDSSSNWTTTANGNLATCGVVSVKSGGLRLPISLAGAEVKPGQYLSSFTNLGDSEMCGVIPLFQVRAMR